MKKLIFVILVLTSACAPEQSDFTTVEYADHTYIIYDGYDFDSGMVHNPDCKCYK